MQTELFGQAATHPDPTHAVAFGVQARRVHTDTQLAGQYRDDSSADAALGRHADGADPVAGPVIHAAGDHDGQGALDHRRVADPAAGLRVHAAARQGGAHLGQIGGGDTQRALPVVHVEHRVGVVVEHSEALQHVADGPVAAAGGLFRGVDLLVQLELPAGECGIPVADEREPLFG